VLRYGHNRSFWGLKVTFQSSDQWCNMQRFWESTLCKWTGHKPE